MKKDIKSMLPEELEVALTEMGEPRFRAKQIFKWLSSGVRSFEDMKNLPLALRKKLDDGRETKLIQTVRGRGYMLCDPKTDGGTT